MNPDEVLVSVIVLAFGEEPLLNECIAAIRSSTKVRLEIVVVDNGCTSDAVDRLPSGSDLRILKPGTNTGFAGGCNLAAEAARGDVLVFVNSDAIVHEGAVAALAARAIDPAVGLASGSVRLMNEPGVLNTAGNPVHFTGLSWAGGLGEPVSRHTTLQPVPSATGCALAVRRPVWEYLGGFNEDMFAYCEDTDLSLRCWQAGWRVEYVPEAIVLHHYEFSRNPQKYYLLERNRLLMLLTVYSGRTLLLLAPPLIALEIAMAAVAARQGWLREKISGWSWLLRHRDEVLTRRRVVQSARRLDDRVLAELLTPQFTPGEESGIPTAPFLSRASTAYWSLVKSHIR